MIRPMLTATLLALGLSSPAWAYRVLEQPESAYELVLGDVLMPGSEAGSVIFRTCSDCDTTSLRVNTATRYTIDGKPLDLTAFSKAVDEIRRSSGGNRNTAVYVYYDVKSRQVNRLAVSRSQQ